MRLKITNGKSSFLMGKSTISMAIFHCYVSSPEGMLNIFAYFGPLPFGRIEP